LLAAGAVAAVTAIYCLTPNGVHAAGATGGPVHVVFSIKQNSGPLPTTTATGPALPTGKGAAGSTFVAAGTKAQTWLEITVRNVGDSDISNLTINYHVFSKTSIEGKTATVTMTDNSGTQTVNIPYGKSVLIKTPPITKQISSGLPSTGNRGGTTSTTAKGGKTAAVTSSTVTDIVGSYVEAVTDNPDKPVSTAEDPHGIVQQYESLQAQAGL
jgi:hypothetical protein